MAMFATGKQGNQLIDMETTLAKTVILWGQDDVLTIAVENLLNAGGDWKVIRISDDLDEVTLEKVMAQVTPDVVIVNEGALTSNMCLLVKFVMDYSKLKIITIGLENNQMEIYNKQTICIKEASDLLAAIEIDADPNNQGGEIRSPSSPYVSAIPVNSAG